MTYKKKRHVENNLNFISITGHVFSTGPLLVLHFGIFSQFSSQRLVGKNESFSKLVKYHCRRTIIIRGWMTWRRCYEEKVCESVLLIVLSSTKRVPFWRRSAQRSRNFTIMWKSIGIILKNWKKDLALEYVLTTGKKSRMKQPFERK